MTTEELIRTLRAEGENAMRRHLSLGMHGLCAEAADRLERMEKALREIRARDCRWYQGRKAFGEFSRTAAKALAWHELEEPA